jgi:hypothetical protein
MSAEATFEFDTDQDPKWLFLEVCETWNTQKGRSISLQHRGNPELRFDSTEITKHMQDFTDQLQAMVTPKIQQLADELNERYSCTTQHPPPATCPDKPRLRKEWICTVSYFFSDDDMPALLSVLDLLQSAARGDLVYFRDSTAMDDGQNSEGIVISPECFRMYSPDMTDFKKYVILKT